MAKVTYDDRAMILDPNRWPCWPYLPVKRKNNSLSDKNLGILVADGKFTVYHVYMFMLPKDFSASPKSEYATVDALLADGWVVD